MIIVKVKLSDIIDAIEMTDQYSEDFLDRETGEIVRISDMTMSIDEQEEACELLDAHGFYRLPSSFDIREYDIMKDFVYSLPESQQSRLARAISGRGAFRRFKDMIHQLGLADRWYEYQASAYRKKAIRWCEENGLEYEE